MSRPEPKMVTRLEAITLVQTLCANRIYPLVVPQGVPLPCIVYQVVSDVPEKESLGPTGTWNATILLTLLARADGGQGYKGIRTLATAVMGNGASGNHTAPTGLAGWIDSEGCVWQIEDSADAPIEVQAGTDNFWAYSITQTYRVGYTL